MLNKDCGDGYCVGEVILSVYGSAFVSVGTVSVLGGGVSFLDVWDNGYTTQINRLRKGEGVNAAESFLKGQAKQDRRRRIVSGAGVMAIGLLSLSEGGEGIVPGILFSCIGGTLLASPRPTEVALQDYKTGRYSAEESQEKPIYVNRPTLSIGPERQPYIILGGHF